MEEVTKQWKDMAINVDEMSSSPKVIYSQCSSHDRINDTQN